MSQKEYLINLAKTLEMEAPVQFIDALVNCSVILDKDQAQELHDDLCTLSVRANASDYPDNDSFWELKKQLGELR